MVTEITEVSFETEVLKSEIPVVKEYQVVSIPLLVFFKGGKQVDAALGAVPEAVIRPKVEALL
jgi:thioredoxin-like negative regulator of GroEL